MIWFWKLWLASGAVTALVYLTAAAIGGSRNGTGTRKLDWMIAFALVLLGLIAPAGLAIWVAYLFFKGALSEEPEDD